MSKMNSIIHRDAQSAFGALQTAAAMQSFEHVDVVSIVISTQGWHIFAKFCEDKVHTDEIDKEIDRRLDGEKDE